MQQSVDSTSAVVVCAQAPVHVGIDDGYACTKVATPDGRLLSIPSTARIGHSNVSWLRKARQKIFEYQTDDTVYSVGDVDAVSTRFDGYATSGLNRAIVQHGLQTAGLGGRSISAVSGMPVNRYYRSTGVCRESDISAKRENLLVPVSPKNGSPAANVTEHRVIPEALAAWYDYVIVEKKGVASIDSERANAPIAVVDIGGRTTDTVVVREQGVLHGATGSFDLGLLDAQRTLADALDARFDLRSDRRLLRAAFQHQTLRLYGRDHDVSGEVHAACQDLVQQLYGEVRRQLGSGADLDCVLFVGGGALALRDYIDDWYPNQVIADQPAFANARGMLKYLRHVCDGADP